MATDETGPGPGWEPLVAVERLREAGAVQSAVGGRALAGFWHEGAPHVVDARCPHMGFPLREGTVEDGLLTCHWHHARFELSCGDTLDPFADDVRAYPATVHEGTVYVDPDPEPDADPAEHWRERLEHGLREGIDLVVAKAVIGLADAGVADAETVRTAASFGVRYRADGWGRGLTTLAVGARLLPHLRPEDRRRALTTGAATVAAETTGSAPAFVQSPLSADVSPDRLTRWFRDAIDLRDPDGAERVLRAAIRGEHPRSAVVAALLGAATDHLYLDSGHRLDFLNKACETLDLVGWSHADELLPSLVPGLAGADRAEESAAWRQPTDVAGLVRDARADLPDLVAAGAGREWAEPDDLLETLLGDEPAAAVDALTDAVAAGASAPALASVVATAAARRVAQFGVANEFRDWNTVHHTYSYANAVDGLARRTDGPVAYRGLFDAAANVYLDRFLNTPPAPLPDLDPATDPAPADGRDPDDLLAALRESFEVERDAEVDRAGRLVAAFLAAGGEAARLRRALGRALLREDAGFHPRQNVEAAFTQHDRLADASPARARLHLVATARYLAAHTPTRRAGEQTFRIAQRLNRGERIHEGDGAAADAG